MVFGRCLSSHGFFPCHPGRAKRDPGPTRLQSLGTRAHHLRFSQRSGEWVPALRWRLAGMTPNDVSGSCVPDGFELHRKRPLSPLEGERSPSSDRGGRGLSTGTVPSVDHCTAGPPLCPVPGHLPRKGGEGRKGRGCAGFGSSFLSTYLILPRTKDLSSPPCHPGRAKRDPGPTRLQSLGTRAHHLRFGKRRGEWVPALRWRLAGMTPKDASGFCFPDGFELHRRRPLSPLEGERSPSSDRGARPFGRDRPFRGSRHRRSPPLSGSRTSPPPGGRGAQGAGLCRVQERVFQHLPDLAEDGRPFLPSVSPRTSKARSGAYSLAEPWGQGTSPSLRQAARRVGPGSALALGREDTGRKEHGFQLPQWSRPHRLFRLFPPGGKVARSGALRDVPRLSSPRKRGPRHAMGRKQPWTHPPGMTPEEDLGSSVHEP